MPEWEARDIVPERGDPAQANETDGASRRSGMYRMRRVD